MIHFFPSRTVALELFGFLVHWYGILYLVAFLLALLILPRLQRFRDLSLDSEAWGSLVSAAVVGVIVGGRLGYVLFYEPAYFLIHPGKILAVWEGGMSSHGGFVGVAIALFVAAWKKKTPMRELADVIVVPAALGLAFGRVGNFINQELYGSVTSLPWGMAIPGVEGLRHPTQIYALLKDLFIAGVCYWYLRSVRPVRPGRTLALFLMLYSVLRYFLEYLRVQQYPLIDTGVLLLTRGQLLTLPLLLVGILLWRWFRDTAESE